MNGHASRSRIALCNATASSSASVVELTSTRSPGDTSRHQSHRSAANASGSGGHGTSSSGKFSAAWARSESQDELALGGRRHPVTAQQLLLALDLEPRDRPRDREALEQQLDRALPGVIAVQAAGQRVRVLAPGGRSQRAAQLEHVAVVVGVRSRRCGELRPLTVAAAHLAAACRSCDATSPVTGSPWPAQATAGPRSASLRIEARACSRSASNAGCGTRTGTPRPDWTSIV